MKKILSTTILAVQICAPYAQSQDYYGYTRGERVFVLAPAIPGTIISVDDRSLTVRSQRGTSIMTGAADINVNLRKTYGCTVKKSVCVGDRVYNSGSQKDADVVGVAPMSESVVIEQDGELVTLDAVNLKKIGRGGGGRQDDRRDSDNRGSHSNNSHNNSNDRRDTPSPNIEDKSLDIAENGARCFASLVAKTYGGAENYRYNIRKGMLTSLRLNNLDNNVLGISLEDTQRYKEGYADGREDGKQKGYAEGKSAAYNDGSIRGKEDSQNRFTSVIDQNQNPDLTMRTPKTPEGKFSIPSFTVESLKSRLQRKEDEVSDAMRNISFTDEEFVLNYYTYSQRWKAYSIYQSDYSENLIVGHYRADWAFSLFKDKKLGRRCNRAVAQYDGIQDYNLRKMFERQFEKEYNSLIDKKMVQAITAPNEEAVEVGIKIGNRIVAEHAYDTGFNDGARATFEIGARQGFADHFATAYGDSFNKTAEHHRSNTIITNVEGQVIPVGGSFVIGAPISFRLDKITNVGGVGADVVVKMKGTNVISNESKTVHVAPYSSNKGQQSSYQNLGRLSQDIKPDTSTTVVVEVGGQTVTINALIDWTMQIKALAKTTEGSEERIELLQYIVTHLQKEYEDARSVFDSNNPYLDKTPNNSLLERLVTTFQALDGQGKRAIAELKLKQLVMKDQADAVAEESSWYNPGSWDWSGKKANLTAAQALYNQLQ